MGGGHVFWKTVNFFRFGPLYIWKLFHLTYNQNHLTRNVIPNPKIAYRYVSDNYVTFYCNIFFAFCEKPCFLSQNEFFKRGYVYRMGRHT